LKFVKTHKAKTNIKKYLNKEEQKIVDAGKELWEKKIKKLKLSFSTSDLSKIVYRLKFDNHKQFYTAVAQGNLNLDDVLRPNKEEEIKEQIHPIEFEQFADIARKDVGGVLVEGKKTNLLYSFAKCCKPIPGDPVIGYITVGEGIKIHRKTCTNLLNISTNESNKLIPVEWPQTEESNFVAGLIVKGEDSPGILNDIAHAIVTFRTTNIKSININTNDSTFEGSVTVYVNNLEHLNRLIDRLKKVRGVYLVERFESN